LLSELFGFFLEHVFDGRIMQEVHQIVDLVSNKLEEFLHHSGHDSHSMCPDTVEHLIHTDSLDLFRLTSSFNESLRVQVVVVV